jgi:23S rRNA (uracil1939-C5)-methyltransferase
MINLSKKNKIAEAENDTFLVNIDHLNSQGEGVGLHKNLKISLEKTLPGEQVEVRYLPQRPRKNRLQVVRILSKSPQRISPPCHYFEQCGGCQLQHISYTTQLEVKRNWIEQLLNNHSELQHVQIKAVSPMPRETYYRCKTQIPFQKKDQAVVYGLYQQGTHEITPINHCLVESRDANKVLEIVREWAENFQISIYNEQTHSGSLRHVLIRKGQFSHQVMVVLVSCTEELVYLKELLQLLKAGIPSLKSVILNHNPERTNRILGGNNTVIWGEEFIE